MANYPENKRQHAKFTYKIYFRFSTGRTITTFTVGENGKISFILYASFILTLY